MVIGVVGPRRTRYGTGPYFMRALDRASVSAVVVLASSGLASMAAAAGVRSSMKAKVYAARDLVELVRWRGIDGIVICSPTALRLSHASVIADAALPLLSEKPFLGHCSRISDTTRIVSRFVGAGVPLHVNYWWRPVVRRLMDLGLVAEWDSIDSLEIWLSCAVSGWEAVQSATPHIASILFELGVATERALLSEGRVDAVTEQVSGARGCRISDGSKVVAIGVMDHAPVRVRARLVVNDIEVERLPPMSNGIERFQVAGHGVILMTPIEQVVTQFLRSISQPSLSDACAVEAIERIRDMIERRWRNSL
jgi:hypothetical protein